MILQPVELFPLAPESASRRDMDARSVATYQVKSSELLAPDPSGAVRRPGSSKNARPITNIRGVGQESAVPGFVHVMMYRHMAPLWKCLPGRTMPDMRRSSS